MTKLRRVVNMRISRCERHRGGPISFDLDLRVGELAGETVAIISMAAG